MVGVEEERVGAFEILGVLQPEGDFANPAVLVSFL